MRDADWTSLVYAVEGGNCTLMLGPDAVTGTLGAERLPVHEALAGFVIDRLGPSFGHLDRTKPSSVAQAAVAAEDPFTLQGWVEEFTELFEPDDDVLRDLAALPFELVINTSPGPWVHRIFQEVKPRTHGDYYDRTAPVRPALPDATASAPVVYNLYGSLLQPSSLILTESDRIDFLVAVVSDEPPLPPKLKSALRDPERSLLFVGFELDQWQFRVLLHVLARDARRRYKSFAFEIDARGLDDDTRDFYRSGHKIHFVVGEPPDFARELRGRVRVPEPVEVPDGVPGTATVDTPGTPAVTAPAVVAAPTESRSILPPDAPVAFICHASEDKEFADQVSDYLRVNGIATWFDRDDLRGGDRWDLTIRRTIGSQVDYVIVLQSASMSAKDVGYVNREIALALDRQMEFRAPRRFLIPAVIDRSESRLVELEHLQATDLSSAAGFDELVRTIKRDVDLKVRQGR
jgi:hypothetical protein